MSPNSRPQDLADELVQAVEARVDTAKNLLGELVARPSLSKLGSDPAVLEESAQFVKAAFADLLEWDFCEVVCADDGAPAFLARKEPTPGYPTVLLYAHHDVQPTGDPTAWTSPPFVATERDGRIYGRGSADDGAGIVTHHSAISAALDTLGGSLDIGLVVFIEGEEESGSPTFAALLDHYAATLAADVIVVADSDNPAPDRPALTTSLRGVVGFTLWVRTLESGRHSGLFGGPAPDAMGVLVRLLGTVYRDDGSVAIEGLGFTAETGGAVDEDQFRHEAGVLPGIELWGSGPLADRLWRSPALTITGIDAPAVSEASNTLLAEVSARVSVRIPPGQDSAQAIEAISRHFRGHAPAGVRIDVEDIESGEGFHQPPDHPLVNLMVSSLEWGFGAGVEFQGVGGTIPFVAHLARRFPGTPIAVTGVEDRDSSAHGIDESVDVSMVERAIRSEAMFFLRLQEGRIQD